MRSQNVGITNSETIPHLQALFTNGSHGNESREGIPMSSGMDASQKLSCNSSAQYAANVDLHASGDNEKKQSIRRCSALFIRRKAGGPANEIRGPPPGGQQQQEQTEPVKGTVYYIKAIITNYQLPVVVAVAVMVITMPLTLRALIQMVKKDRATRSPVSAADASLRMAAIYIPVICLISLTSLVPIYIMRPSTKKIPKPTILFFRFMRDGYCVLNVVIYGFMNKQYREFLRSLLPCKKRVTP